MKQTGKTLTEAIAVTAGVSLKGILEVPSGAEGLVIFVHGSGSSRFSPRNKYVADELNSKGLATLLLDLLTEEEDAVYENRFDIELLTKRLVEVTKWCEREKAVEDLPIGFFGASTGAAAALKAAVDLGDAVKAVVSRGGRPDLAGEALARVKSPTLLIVGGLDMQVIALNQEAFEKLSGVRQLEIVAGATHLFEEPGTLAEVARLAGSWFGRYLQA